ncbi:TetR/AcrR family transcriptional regulator [Arthrobacter sp. NPDC058192]|uniref:TetR/AcrR family transcriptional regulator n=1 Tax=Arthrobacter sp. NPDC058192 TaxID=3346372 RepID=UPI0036EE9505
MTPRPASAAPAAQAPAGRAASRAAGHAAAGTAKEKILATAFRLFYAQGFRAAGIDTIIAESGVAKATFYKYFPAKDDLILAYLEKVDGVWSRELHAAAEAAGDDPAAQLVGLFDALTIACRRDGYRGCAFINAAAESLAGTRVHDRTVAHKQQILAWIRDLAARAGAGNPDQLARSLTLLLDGGLASGVLDGSPDAASAARSTAAQLVAVSLKTPTAPQVTRSRQLG